MKAARINLSFITLVLSLNSSNITTLFLPGSHRKADPFRPLRNNNKSKKALNSHLITEEGYMKTAPGTAAVYDTYMIHAGAANDKNVVV